VAASTTALEEEDILFAGCACVGAAEVDDGVAANLRSACTPLSRRIEAIRGIMDSVAVPTGSAVVRAC
jgi:hypothetical protein